MHKNFPQVSTHDFLSKEKREERFNKSQKKKVNLFNEVLDSSKLYGPYKKIVEDINGSVDYKKLLISSYVMSEKLDKKFMKEDTLGTLLPNSIAHLVVLLSLFKLGKTPGILNFSMGEQTLLDCIETGDIKTVITSKAFVIKGKLEDVIDFLKTRVNIVYLEDIAKEITTVDKLKGAMQYQLKTRSNSKSNELIVFTSGSESKPKGVVLTHSNIYSNTYQAICSIDINHQDKIFNPLPMFHSFGLSVGSLLPLLFGIETFMYPSPLHYKEIPALIFKQRSTILFGTSTFLEGYARYAQNHELQSLKYVIAGAEKVREEVHSMWLNKFGIRILEGYGCTETSPVLALNTPFHFKPGSVGQFIPGIEYKIQPVEGIENGGCLLVKGPNIMKGYLIHQKGFIPCKEWYNTGDVVEIDEEGYIHIKSRLKRFAKVAGEMISLNLVEDLAINNYEDTGFAAVSITDKRKGEKIILFTTRKDVKEKNIKKYIKSRKLSTLLVPSAVEHIEEIPVLGSGKTDYVTLQKLAESI